jgi:hypothetical protein
MKSLLRSLLIAFLVTGLLTGCDEDPAQDDTPAEETEAVDEQEESAGVDGEVVEDEESAAAEDLDLEGQQWLESELYGVKLAVPDTWEVGHGENVVSATDSHKSTTVLIGGSQSETTLLAAINDLRSELSFKEVEVESGDVTQLAGIPAHWGEGTAVVVDEDLDTEIQFLGYLLRMDGESVTILIFSEATMYEAKKDIIDGIAQTVTRI